MQHDCIDCILTVLGPLIFIVYIDDIIDIFNHVKVSLFADDCIVYLSGYNWQNVKEPLQCHLDKIDDWCCVNALALNARKPKSMILGNRSKLDNIVNQTLLKIGDSDVEFVNRYE